MSLAFDIAGPTRRLNRQATTIDLLGKSSVNPLRRHHSSLDLLQLTKESKNDRNPASYRSLDAMGLERRKLPPAVGCSPDSNSRPGSKTSEDDKTEYRSPRKFPILGPTRQQAEFYFKQKSKQLQGLTLSSSATSELGKHLSASDKALLESSDDAEKLRASFASLTTTSLGPHNSEHLGDVRFFAELVKPMQYRLKLNKRKEKVIFPSKYGYHPRSHSPTFKRLIEATEKLEVIAKEEFVEELKAKAELEKSHTVYTSTDLDNSYNREIRRYGTYKLNVARNNVIEVSPPKVEPLVQPITKSLQIPQEYPPKEAIAEADIEEDIEEDEQDDDEDYNSDEDNSSEAYFKVDFRVSDDAHAQLHLFLPKINDIDNESKTARFGSGSVKNEVKKTGKLPQISSSHTSGSSMKNSNVRRSKKSDVTRKKKRKLERIRSAADTDHKRVRDHLNDVSTMMSIERDFHGKKHDHDSLCAFENCPYHSIQKNNIPVS